MFLNVADTASGMYSSSARHPAPAGRVQKWPCSTYRPPVVSSVLMSISVSNKLISSESDTMSLWSDLAKMIFSASSIRAVVVDSDAMPKKTGRAKSDALGHRVPTTNIVRATSAIWKPLSKRFILCSFRLGAD